MKKRVFSLFLVFTLCLVSVDKVYADAGSLVIAGGSVAGVTAGAIAGPAVVAVFCAMMAFGMNVELTEASEEAGMTKTQFIKNKLQEYCNEAQISFDTFNSYILSQMDVFQNGAISLTDQAGKTIERFCNWLFESEYVQDADTDIPSSITLKGLTWPVLMPGDSMPICYANGGDAMVVYNTGTKPIALICLHGSLSSGEIHGFFGITSNVNTFENFRMTTTYGNQSQSATSYSYSINGFYCADVAGMFDRYISNVRLTPYECSGSSFREFITEFTNGLDPIFLENTSVNSDVITGNYSDYDTSKGVLNPTQDQTIIINPNITIPVPDDKDITIDVNEYLDVVQDMIDGLRDDVISAIDDATGVPITIEFDPTQDWNPTIEKEDDDQLDNDKTPVIEEDKIPIDYDIDPLTFDLKGVFPFCIPWDVRDMLSKLNASPVAPSYTVNWHIPIVNENLVFTVDLSPYDNVASILRNMEVLAFCIGLALITRQMILRG